MHAWEAVKFDEYGLPHLVWWKMRSGILLTSIPGNGPLVQTAESYDHHTRSANKAVLRQLVPYGATHFSLSPEGPWDVLSELPESWGLKCL